jgi:hypothetical protein
MTINKEWHLQHKMPKNPKPAQRYEWHLEHSQNCKCRQMPDKLKEEIENWKKQNIK